MASTEPLSALTASRLRALHQDGFVLLPGVLAAAQIAMLRQAIDSLQPMHWDYSGLCDHYKCVFNRDPLWLPYLDLGGIIELAEAALGPIATSSARRPGAAIPASSAPSCIWTTW